MQIEISFTTCHTARCTTSATVLNRNSANNEEIGLCVCRHETDILNIVLAYVDCRSTLLVYHSAYSNVPFCTITPAWRPVSRSPYRPALQAYDLPTFNWCFYLSVWQWATVAQDESAILMAIWHVYRVAQKVKCLTGQNAISRQTTERGKIFQHRKTATKVIAV